MEYEAQREGDRCVSICRRRAELWRRMAARNPPAGALEEARGRANEAAYLADLLESGADVQEPNPTNGDDADVFYDAPAVKPLGRD
jgi:hypothetical protein